MTVTLKLGKSLIQAVQFVTHLQNPFIVLSGPSIYSINYLESQIQMRMFLLMLLILKLSACLKKILKLSPVLYCYNFYNFISIGDAGSAALQSDADPAGNVTRTSTRTWAKQSEYDPIKLFTKFFSDDVKYLLSMDKLWQKRTPPTPLTWDSMSESGKSM